MNERKFFDCGTILVTAAVDKRMANDPIFGNFVVQCLTRYLHCDWGELDDEDKLLNEEALISGGRLMGVYVCPSDKEKIWLITETDHNITTILFPSDY